MADELPNFDFFEQILGVDSTKAVLIAELVGKIIAGLRRGLTNEHVDEDQADRILQMLWSQTIGSMVQTMQAMEQMVIPVSQTPSEILGREQAISIIRNAMAKSNITLHGQDKAANEIIDALDKMISKKREPKDF